MLTGRFSRVFEVCYLLGIVMLSWKRLGDVYVDYPAGFLLLLHLVSASPFFSQPPDDDHCDCRPLIRRNDSERSTEHHSAVAQAVNTQPESTTRREKQQSFRLAPL